MSEERTQRPTEDRRLTLTEWGAYTPERTATRIRDLENVIAEYGAHHDGCPATFERDPKCTCGWATAIGWVIDKAAPEPPVADARYGLAAEVSRLLGEVARLTALVEVLRPLAESDPCWTVDSVCGYCGKLAGDGTQLDYHAPDCEWVKARAALSLFGGGRTGDEGAPLPDGIGGPSAQTLRVTAPVPSAEVPTQEADGGK